MKKLLCMLLAMLMVLSLAACGGESKEAEETKEDKKNKDKESSASADKLAEKDGTIFFGSDKGRQKLEANPNPLDPTTVYGNLTYDERMLYGRFMLNNEEKDLPAYAETAVYEDLEYSETHSIYTAEENLTTEKLSTLPVELQLGTSCSLARKLRGQEEWCTLYLLNERGYKIDVLCTYEVSGNTVTFYPLDAYQEELDEEFKTARIRYTVGKDGLEYTFQVRGTSLTLTREGQSVTLKTWYFTDNSDSRYMGGYLADNSPAFENIDHFSLSKTSELNTVYITDRNKELYTDSDHMGYAAARMTEEGQLSIYWETEDEEGNVTEHLKHFIYFPGDGYNCTLYDGEIAYYYCETSLSREYVALGEGMSQEDWEKLNGLSDSELNKIVEKKENLLEDLAKAYEDAGLNVSINHATGEIALDSTVLFGVDKSDISEEGKAFLQQFAQVYTSVVYSEKYEGFVSKVLVEGHTDTSGSYDHNKKLSQDRADSVKAYCTSAECGIDAAYAENFSQSLEAIGYSCDKPVYGSDSKVDMAASRRVSFRFVISLESGE